MNQTLLIVGLVLLLSGFLGAILATTEMGAGAAITTQSLRQLLIVEIISFLVSLSGIVLLIISLIIRPRSTLIRSQAN